MILILLGTQDKPFPRLLRMVDQAKLDGLICSEEELVAQAGCTHYEPRCSGFSLQPFFSHDEYLRMIEQASLVITHAGLSSLADSINARKRIIAVPRRKRYGEHQNDHQLQLSKKLAREGYILECQSEEDFAVALMAASTFEPRPYQSTAAEVISLVRDAINDQLPSSEKPPEAQQAEGRINR